MVFSELIDNMTSQFSKNDNSNHKIISQITIENELQQGMILLNNRKDIVEEIAKFKSKNQLTIFQLERWFEILRTRKEIANNLGLDAQMIAELFELIHKYSILTQTNIMRK